MILLFNYDPAEDFYCLYCSQKLSAQPNEILALLKQNTQTNHLIKYNCCHDLNKKIHVDYTIGANHSENMPAWIPPVKGEFYMYLSNISIYWSYKQFTLNLVQYMSDDPLNGGSDLFSRNEEEKNRWSAPLKTKLPREWFFLPLETLRVKVERLLPFI